MPLQGLEPNQLAHYLTSSWEEDLLRIEFSGDFLERGVVLPGGGGWPDGGVGGSQTGDPGPTSRLSRAPPSWSGAQRRPLSAWVEKGKHVESRGQEGDRDRLKHMCLGPGSVLSGLRAPIFGGACCAAYGILVPGPGRIPGPSALEARSPNHWKGGPSGPCLKPDGRSKCSAH